jgi:hypothetical protein
MFSNAFGHPRDYSVIDLLEAEVDAPFKDLREVVRYIERMRTQVFATGLILNSGCKNGYELQRMVRQRATDPSRAVDCGTGLFYRMRQLGSPSLARALHEKRSAAHWWVSASASVDRQALEDSFRPIWRLMHPALISHVDMVALENAVMARVDIVPDAYPRDLYVRQMRSEPRAVMSYAVPGGLVDTLTGLEWTLLQLRKAEVLGQLLPYYLSFLKALDRCAVPSTDAELEVVRLGCKRLLESCFGRVHIALLSGTGVSAAELWNEIKVSAMKLRCLHAKEDSWPVPASVVSRLPSWVAAVEPLTAARDRDSGIARP